MWPSSSSSRNDRPNSRVPMSHLNDIQRLTKPLSILMTLCVLTTISIDIVESSTQMIQPSNSAATLIPGQPLYFECGMIGVKNAQFLWYKTSLRTKETSPLDPSSDDSIVIHNERLVLQKPGYDAIGDYTCRALSDTKEELPGEEATVKVRAQPYIDDFDITTSHTGKSAVVTEGERIELICHVRDDTVPVNITWLRSVKSDDDGQMTPIPELEDNQATTNTNYTNQVYTHTVSGLITVEKVDSFTKKLIIQEVGPEHRSYYSCIVDNGVTERARKTIFIRVKDKIVALWPLLGIIAELFILFTIIHIWETQRAQKAIQNPSVVQPAPKRPASGPVSAFENVPLNA